MKKINNKKMVLLVVLAAVLLAVAFAAGYYIYLDSLFDEKDAGNLSNEVKTEVPVTAEDKKEGHLNILVACLDYSADDDGRDYADGKGTTDVLMYVNMHTSKDGTTSMNILQIPRDAYVGADKSPNGRLNGVYANGANQTDLIDNLATQIYNDYQLPIDTYVVFDMDVFITVVNTMGGIELYLPWDIYDEFGREIKQGTHRLSGEDALWVVRQRHMYAQEDIKRLEMQQYFYKAVFKTLMEDFTLLDAPSMAKQIGHYTKTDMNLAQIGNMCLKLLDVKEENIYIVRAPGGPLQVDIPGFTKKQWVYGINAEKLAPILNEHFRLESSPIPASALKVLTGFDYQLGENYDEGKSLADLVSE